MKKLNFLAFASFAFFSLCASDLSETALASTQALSIVQIGDPALRSASKELSRDEILSAEIQDLIEKMKVTMRAAPGVGLAAPQIGRNLQVAVIEDVNLCHLSPQELKERGRRPVSFHVIINPRIYIQEDSEFVEFFEGCLSVPELTGVVPRATSVRVECLNESAEPVVIEARGWHARILQHEIDHLNGKIFIDRALLSTMTTFENFNSRWRGKSVKEAVAALDLNSNTKESF